MVGLIVCVCAWVSCVGCCLLDLLGLLVVYCFVVCVVVELWLVCLIAWFVCAVWWIYGCYRLRCSGLIVLM